MAYEKVNKRLKHEFESIKFFAITSDLWSSKTNDSYNAITLHYFEPKTSQLESKILECQPFTTKHSGEELKKDIAKRLDSFGICVKEVIMVSDNVANIKLASRLLKIPWLGCNGHNYHLIFKDGKDGCPEVKQVFERFSNVVTATRVSFLKLFKMYGF